ncbi:helix-turn-helix domain-containing protein [Roseiconus nitratireducens]
MKTYRPQDLTEILHLRPTQIYRLIQNGELAAVNVSSGTRRARYIVTEEELRDFLQRRTVRKANPTRPNPYVRRWR